MHVCVRVWLIRVFLTLTLIPITLDNFHIVRSVTRCIKVKALQQNAAGLQTK